MGSVGDKKSWVISITVGVLEIILMYFTFHYYHGSAAYISHGSITMNNAFGRLGFDSIAMLVIPVV